MFNFFKDVPSSSPVNTPKRYLLSSPSNTSMPLSKCWIRQKLEFLSRCRQYELSQSESTSLLGCREYCTDIHLPYQLLPTLERKRRPISSCTRPLETTTSPSSSYRQHSRTRTRCHAIMPQSGKFGCRRRNLRCSHQVASRDLVR